VIVLVLNAMPATAAVILFGTATLARLVPPATIALAGIALHSMVYAIYRGRSEMGIANAMQLVNLGLMPLLAFALSRHDAAAVLEATGIGWLAVSAALLVHILYRERSGLSHLAQTGRHLRTLLRFGLPRIPGEFALVGLYAIPALIAVRAHGVAVAGQFSAAMSVLTMASGVFAPVGLVVLPIASQQAATGDMASLRRMVRRILGGGILLSIAGVMLGELLIPPLVEWYFGPGFVPAIPVFRICLLGTVPYAIYILMRTVLDAVDVKAVNSRNLIISLVTVIVLCLVNRSIIWMSWSLVAALSLLGALTLRDTYQRVK
jgi:O-antigen/teichoic acid export membrane protein